MTLHTESQWWILPLAYQPTAWTPSGLLRGGLGAYAPYKLKAEPQVEGIAMPGTLQPVPMAKVGLCPKTGLTSVDNKNIAHAVVNCLLVMYQESLLATKRV